MDEPKVESARSLYQMHASESTDLHYKHVRRIQGRVEEIAWQRPWRRPIEEEEEELSSRGAIGCDPFDIPATV